MRGDNLNHEFSGRRCSDHQAATRLPKHGLVVVRMQKETYILPRNWVWCERDFGWPFFVFGRGISHEELPPIDSDRLLLCTALHAAYSTCVVGSTTRVSLSSVNKASSSISKIPIRFDLENCHLISTIKNARRTHVSKKTRKKNTVAEVAKYF